MPVENENMQNLVKMYKELFGTEGVDNVEEKVASQMQSLKDFFYMSEPGQDYLDYTNKHLKDYNSQEAEALRSKCEDLYVLRYMANCNSLLTKAMNHNLDKVMHGKEGALSAFGVEEKFITYMQTLESEVGMFTATHIGAKNIADWTATGYINGKGSNTNFYKVWKENVLDKAPNKIELEANEIYGIDKTTGEKMSVEQSMAVADEKLKNISTMPVESGLDSCRKRLIEQNALLRAVEQKNASRGFWWKLFHYFGDNALEKGQIAEIKKCIDNSQEIMRSKFGEESTNLTDADFERPQLPEEDELKFYVEQVNAENKSDALGIENIYIKEADKDFDVKSNDEISGIIEEPDKEIDPPETSI